MTRVVEVSSGLELRTSLLPMAVCPLWALVVSPVTLGAMTYYFPIPHLVQAVVFTSPVTVADPNWSLYFVSCPPKIYSPHTSRCS